MCIVTLTAAAATPTPADICTDNYLPLLAGKRVAVFCNHTASVNGTHLVDLLHAAGVNLTVAFAPEHGFRGDADAGASIADSRDAKTGLPIVSLYGGAKNAMLKAMNRFDVLVIDIQDVGLRFYTYYITMLKLMDACAAKDKEIVILDRPNPNGHIVDGPVLDMRYKSGVGALPVPVLHGLTLGEMARMAIGEGWVSGEKKAYRFTVVPCLNYSHSMPYPLETPPSPNLPDMTSVYLYASLCYFEATPVSLGRGTDKPFQIYGHPAMKGHGYDFTPTSRAGATNPPQKDKLCHGADLSSLPADSLRNMGVDLTFLIDAYRDLNIGDSFFTPFFEKLIGVGYVREMIERGKSASEISALWQDDVKAFKEKRRQYLLYPED